MSRKLRFIPEGGALVEVTCRTVQGRLLLVPSGDSQRSRGTMDIHRGSEQVHATVPTGTGV